VSHCTQLKINISILQKKKKNSGIDLVKIRKGSKARNYMCILLPSCFKIRLSVFFLLHNCPQPQQISLSASFSIFLLKLQRAE
jgi:hypothetical protein